MSQGTNVTETIKFSTESFALEMLKQYYEDLRSMYNSIFNIFKLSSVGIALASGIVTFYKYGDSTTLKGAEIAILSVTLIVVLAFFLISSIIIIGQGYRYRITQGMCHLIRSEYDCAKFVPESLLWFKYSDEGKEDGKHLIQNNNCCFLEIFKLKIKQCLENLSFIPTVFRNIYIFFVCCSFLTALTPNLFIFTGDNFNCILPIISGLTVFFLIKIFRKSIQSHKEKTVVTLKKIKEMNKTNSKKHD